MIFNYSTTKLTESQESLLNKGLNFSILPLKLDITEVLLEYKKFERKMVWFEFWHGKENEQPQKENIFKSTKNNLPRDHQSPQGMKDFLSSVKSEIMDPRNRNNEKCNLPVNEVQALKELISLQKERVIVIKACDKGSGIIILDFDKYLKACYDHLLSTQEGSNLQYYKEVQPYEIEISKIEIRTVLKQALDGGIITKEEFAAMDPTEKDVAKFYMNFKIHKDHKEGEAPPPRPIISGSGSMTEGIAKYVAYKIRDKAKSHSTYLEDTPDFLRAMEDVKDLEDDDILASIDVKALFTNIPKQEGLKALNDAIETIEHKEFVMKLMELVLNHNLFSFHEGIFRQEIGSAMGASPIPDYADIFMDIIDKQIKIAATKGKGALKLLKRFLDDLFLIFKGTTKELHLLLDRINQINPSIQFTMKHTTRKSEEAQDKCSCEELKAIPFLDTLCSIEKGKIEIDLYKKSTDKNQYLLLNSCHPKAVTKSIPFSLSLRIVRICTKFENRVIRLKQLKSLLKDRGYPDRVIDPAIERALKISRPEALKKVRKDKNTKRPVFTVKYDPRLPCINPIINKHWRSMITRDEYLKEVFKEPPLTAFKKQKSIKDNIIRAKVAMPSENKIKRKNPGMKKCGKWCTACPYIKEGKSVKINQKKTWNINRNVNCETTNIVYLIECSKCSERYIGESSRSLKSRLADHRGYINRDLVDTATGAHFHTPGHDLSHLTITILEQPKNKIENYRKEREKYLINLFNTYYRGMNKQK